MQAVFLMTDFVSRLEQVLGQPDRSISLHEPEFSGDEWNYVKERLDTGWASFIGKFADQFDSKLARRCWSKIITMGGGEAILTNDSEAARRHKHLTTTAEQANRREFVHDEAAYNYRLPSLNAALGFAQLERLPDKLRHKRTLSKAYIEAFANSPEFSFVAEPSGCTSTTGSMPFACPQTLLASAMRFSVQRRSDYQCCPVRRLMHRLSMCANCSSARLPVAEKLEWQLINIPSSVLLSAKVPCG